MINQQDYLFLDKGKTTINQPDLVTEQQVKLKEIGEQLRQFRETNAISLERVSAVTMIRLDLLEAIENGNLSALPEAIYTKGLIKKYADIMGLEGDSLAAKLPIVSPVVKSDIKPTKFTFPQLRPHHLYVVYVALIFLSLSILPRLMRNDLAVTTNNLPVSEGLASVKPPTEKEVTLVKSSKPPAQTITPQAAGTHTQISVSNNNRPTASGKTQPVNVSLIVKDESWVLVEVDGKKEFEGLLTAGTERNWTAQQKLVVVAGNAGGVFLAVNNEQAKQLGAPGKVEEVILKAVEDSQEKTLKN
ncbi:MAG: helix-turn-helix domain-containing protein [Microcoleaceae cyanobacterium]